MKTQQNLVHGSEAAAKTTQEPDWQAEYEGLSEGNYFKPKSGVPYAVTFLDAGGQVYEKDFSGEVKQRRDFRVRVMGGEYRAAELTWTLTVGGKKSLYGMLLAVFAARKGSIIGSSVNVGANGDGRDRKYVLQEYNNLLFAGGS